MSERERDSIPEIDVTYVASLARLELTDEETARFQEQLANIVSFVDTLSSLDVEGVAPTAHPTPLLDCFREDKPSEGLVRDQFLRNTPDSGLNQVRVPKVVDS